MSHHLESLFIANCIVSSDCHPIEHGFCLIIITTPACAAAVYLCMKIHCACQRESPSVIAFTHLREMTEVLYNSQSWLDVPLTMQLACQPCIVYSDMLFSAT